MDFKMTVLHESQKARWLADFHAGWLSFIFTVKKPPKQRLGKMSDNNIACNPDCIWYPRSNGHTVVECSPTGSQHSAFEGEGSHPALAFLFFRSVGCGRSLPGQFTIKNLGIRQL